MTPQYRQLSRENNARVCDEKEKAPRLPDPYIRIPAKLRRETDVSYVLVAPSRKDMTTTVVPQCLVMNQPDENTPCSVPLSPVKTTLAFRFLVVLNNYMHLLTGKGRRGSRKYTE